MDNNLSYSVLSELQGYCHACSAEEHFIPEGMKRPPLMDDEFYLDAIKTIEDGLKIVFDIENEVFSSARKYNNDHIGDLHKYDYADLKDVKKTQGDFAPIPSAEEQQIAKEAICFHKALDMKRHSRISYHARHLKAYHDSWLNQLAKEGEIVTTHIDYVFDDVEPKKLDIKIEHTEPCALVEAWKTKQTPEAKPANSRRSDLIDRFNMLCGQVDRMTAARAPKSAWCGGKKGAIIKEGTKMPRSKAEFNYVPHGDLSWITICEAVSYCHFMWSKTFDPRWRNAYNAGVKQKREYRRYSVKPLTNMMDAAYAFCSTEFDRYCEEKAILFKNSNPKLAKLYEKYNEVFKGFTRSNQARGFDLGLDAKKKRLDDYNMLRTEAMYGIAMIGNTFNNPSYQFVDTDWYDICVQAAAEAVMFTKPATKPELFAYSEFEIADSELAIGDAEREAGLSKDVYHPDNPAYAEFNWFDGTKFKCLDLFLDKDEHQFVQHVIRRAMYQELKGGDRAVCVGLLAKDEFKKFMHEEDDELTEQIELMKDVDRKIYKSLDDLTKEELDEEVELLKLKTTHPYDSECVMYHFESLDSRIINGTDCRIAFWQLIHAKTRAGFDAFTEREKLLLVLKRQGMSDKEIGEKHPINGESEDYARVAYEFTRLWNKPAAQAWLKDLGYKGEIEARAQRERYENERARPDPTTGKKVMKTEARDAKRRLIAKEYAHDAKIIEQERKRKERIKELEEKKREKNIEKKNSK